MILKRCSDNPQKHEYKEAVKHLNNFLDKAGEAFRNELKDKNIVDLELFACFVSSRFPELRPLD